MSQMTLQDLSKKMKDIDLTMLTTRSENGELAARPMSNNGQVYEGDSYFFTWAQSRMVDEIQREPKVGLAFQGSKSLLGKPGIFVSVEGAAELSRDKGDFQAHWSPDLDRWFENGIDTPGVVMIKVHATRIHYWDGEDDGEIELH